MHNTIRGRSGFFTTWFLMVLSFPVTALAEEQPVPPTVKIKTDFPGGNVLVEKNAGRTVQLAPDLRGDRPWFYWYFEATAPPGRVTFVFPEKVIGFKNGAIGLQGPAISTDRGLTWQWAGTDNVEENRFHYDFTTELPTVRFAVTIPYVKSDLDRFLEQHSDNPLLVKSVLTESRQHRPVELLRIGTPGDHKTPVLFTARHHASETIASYLLEGVMQAALADTPESKLFREKYLLYVVPFVDKDGVEKGDQGKNRQPHDHNRDYNAESLYPEVAAIKRLHASQHFRIALDFHCPTLVMPDHQVLYFVGPKSEPPQNHIFVSQLAERIKDRLPETAPHGPLVWLKDTPSPAPMFSQYFAHQEGVLMSATLEMPFAPPGKKTDPASCREYGRAILHAFVATPFAE